MSKKVLSSSLSESSIKSGKTPPIRRVIADSLSLISSDNINLNHEIDTNTNIFNQSISKKNLEKNSYDSIKKLITINNNQLTTVLGKHSIISTGKSSSSSKTSNNHSLISYSPELSLNEDDGDDDDDDVSSNYDTNHQWDLHEQQLNPPLTRLVTDVLSSLFNDNQITKILMSECKICFKELSVEPLLCCSSSICLKCVYHYLTTNINEARIRITCPSCPYIFTPEEILSLLSNYDHNGNISERYKRFYTDTNREAHIKTCPRCCSIKQVDKRLFEGIRWKKKDSTKISL
ncbi:unnamed protein product [Rotaria magnacalcarata]